MALESSDFAEVIKSDSSVEDYVNVEKTTRRSIMPPTIMRQQTHSRCSRLEIVPLDVNRLDLVHAALLKAANTKSTTMKKVRLMIKFYLACQNNDSIAAQMVEGWIRHFIRTGEIKLEDN
jgi:hypothetical protein